jgi:hypothetical protein
LGGLPGLILEAYEQNKNVQFTLKDITLTESPPEFRKMATVQLSDKPNYLDYIRAGNTLIKKLKGQMAAVQTGDCIDCQTKSTIKIELLENVFN